MSRGENQDFTIAKLKIQKDFGNKFEVTEEKLLKNLIKMIGIHEQERDKKDEELTNQIMKQN